jgi:hypothetical protein
MRTLLGKSLAVPVAAIAILGGTIPVAFADSAEATPVEESVLQPGPPPEEDQGLVPAPTEEAELPPTSSKPEDGTNADYCGPPKNVYKPTANHGRVHAPVGATQANYNGTSRTARSWFKSEAGGEIGISVSGEVKVSGNVMLAEIEGKYGVDLSAKLTVKIGNEMQVDTPPKKTTYGRYGVWRMKNTGTSYTIYSNCKTSPKSTVISHTPWTVGWYLWER